MKVMERFGREARRSSMAAAATDGLSGRRERMSNKRRRGEESVDEEEDCKVEVEDDNMVLSQMSSSARRRNHTVVRESKQGQPLKVIGVQVPRKARSASAKRSHENSSSGNDGVGKDQNLQKQNVEARKKMKQIGNKNRPPKSPKLSPGPVEEDIENEIAEVLFGLLKQSQSSKDDDSVKSSTSKQEDKHRYSIRNDSKTSISESSHASDPELKNVSKENNSIAEAVEVESKQQPKKEASLPNWEPKSEGASGSIELQKEEAKPFVEESVCGEVPQLESKMEDKFEFDLMAPPPMEDSASDNVAEAVLETLQDKKIEVINDKLNENINQDSDTELQQQPKAIIPKLERTDWRSGLSATTLQPGSSPLSQPCAKRCATHHYIARNIYLHQKATRTNNLWPRAAGSAPICDTKPDIVIGTEILGSVSGHSAKESKGESSEPTFIEASRTKKLVAQQYPSQPASGGNLMHGSTFKFSVGQNQASVAATSNPSGPSKYTELTNNASHFSHSALSTVAAATVSSPNVTFQEGPYLAINGYSFPMTTPSGTTLAFQGGNSQAVPLYNGPFYSNQIFHPSQLHQQQPHSQFQHQVQSSHHKNTGMSTDSSKSHRQPESRQLQKTQFISMQSQQSQKKYVAQSLQPRKVENDIIGGHPATSSRAQHSVYGYRQNFAVPLQPMNFTMMPYVTSSGGGSGNHIEQSQQQDLKGVFGMSFGSMSGNKGTGTLLNFSSMPQNPAMYQNLPITQGTHQKNHQVSERKTGSVSDNSDHDGSKAVTGSSSPTVAQTLVFDNSATNLNFTTSNSHQQRLYQFQLLQQQPAMAARSKASKSTHVFSQPPVQCNTSIQSPNNSGRSLISHVPVTTSTVNSFLQQGRVSQGQTQISFGGNPKSSLAVPQGQLTNPSLLTT
ncbi:PREDICTED: protein TIME FOR COFFEE-like [Fragaria vesca subsp. vesca]|nr:PREDICTED: protein TIME FOR COFFEE isoform X2 [Fragaria vesca subsp. vesca]